MVPAIVATVELLLRAEVPAAGTEFLQVFLASIVVGILADHHGPGWGDRDLGPTGRAIVGLLLAATATAVAAHMVSIVTGLSRLYNPITAAVSYRRVEATVIKTAGI